MHIIFVRGVKGVSLICIHGTCTGCQISRGAPHNCIIVGKALCGLLRQRLCVGFCLRVAPQNVLQLAQVIVLQACKFVELAHIAVERFGIAQAKQDILFSLAIQLHAKRGLLQQADGRQLVPAQHAQGNALGAHGQHGNSARHGKNQQNDAKPACKFSPKRNAHIVLTAQVNEGGI